MTRTAAQSIRILLPDTGPLISLALAGELSLLLRIAADVRLVVTDVVQWEARHRVADMADAELIDAFLHEHTDRVEVMPTTIGQLALADLRRREAAGEAVTLAGDLGELSIANAIISMRRTNPGEPTLVLVEDDWFAANVGNLPGNFHVLSTASFLQGLERLGIIESAAAVRAKIMQWRPHFREAFWMDRAALKIEGGTEWLSEFER